MRGLLQRIWSLPWPGIVRRILSYVAVSPGLRTLLVPQFMVGVVGLIENDSGELLVLRHTYRGEYPWGLPTGFLEHNEDPAGALRRELREETGLDVLLTELVRITTDEKRPLLDIVYRGIYSGGEFRPSAEVDMMRFCGVDDLPPLRPDQAKLARLALRGLEESHENAP
jgi:8-oxo-dGTP diphosphatase